MSSQSTDELKEQIRRIFIEFKGPQPSFFDDKLDVAMRLITSYTDKKTREARKNATRLRLEREIFRLQPHLSMDRIHERALEIEDYWVESCLPDVLEAQLNGSEK